MVSRVWVGLREGERGVAVFEVKNSLKLVVCEGEARARPRSQH